MGRQGRYVSGDFRSLYLEHARTHKARNTVRTEISNWGQLTAFLKPKKLGDVTQSDVESLRRHFLEDLGQAPPNY